MGAGFHGGFGAGTRGSTPPIISNGDLRYEHKKYDGYLLNDNHPKGSSKAKFFKDVLGYSSGDGKKLHQAFVTAIKGKIPSQTENTEYGLKHTYHVSIKGKDNKNVTANVVVIIQKDNGRVTYKIVTAYPDKKEK